MLWGETADHKTAAVAGKKVLCTATEPFLVRQRSFLTNVGTLDLMKALKSSKESPLVVK